MILLDTITELQRCACDEMEQGETRERTLFEVFCLLLLLRDNISAHTDALSRIQTSIVLERRAA